MAQGDLRTIAFGVHAALTRSKRGTPRRRQAEPQNRPASRTAALNSERINVAPSTGASCEKPRVLLVGPSKHFLSGIAYYTYGLAGALSSTTDLSVLLIRRLMPRWLYPGGARVGQDLSNIELPVGVPVFNGLDYFWGISALRAWRFLRSQRPEVLVLQWWTGTVLHSFLLLSRLARRYGARVVLEFHESLDPAEQTHKLLTSYVNYLSPRLFDSCSGFVVHSSADVELIVSTYRIPRHLVTVVPHAVYDHQQGAGPIEARSSGPVCELLFFGLIRPVKGLDDLIAAFDALDDEEASTYRLTIVGETWERCEWIIEAARSSKHHERITIVNRYVSDAESDRYFREADVVVLPYRSSSQSGVLHLAMGYGLPVVATDVGGLGEAAANYPGAELVEPNDPVSLMDGIRRARKLRPGSFRYAQQWQDTAADYRKIFDHLVDQNSGAAS